MEREETRSVIGEDLLVKGEISTEGAIWIHGQIDGDATAKTIVVEKSGSVTGTLSADTVVVAGTVEGAVSARTIEIKEGGCVEAEVQHENIVVASGAVLLGQVRRRAYKPSRGAPAAVDVNTAIDR